MQVVIFADQNPRASIAALRSLCYHKIGVYVAIKSNSKLRFSFLNYTNFIDINKRLLRYEECDEKSLVNTLYTFREQIGQYILFPSGEKILRWVIAHKNELAQAGIILPTVNLESYEIISNKQSFINISQAHGLDVPSEFTELPTTFKEKFVIKAKTGIWDTESVLTRPVLVQTPKALNKLREKNLNLDAHFIQEYINGPSFYYCALYDRGEKKISFTQQTIVQQPSGMSVVKAVPATLPETVVRKIDLMMESLNWYGLMMIEVKEFNDKYYAIECNPRLWGPIQLVIDNGADFPYALWQLATKQPITGVSMVEQPYGYIWTLGYLHGLLLKWQSKTAFQIYSKTLKRRVVFRDVWFRRDAYTYFFVELFTILKTFVKVLVRN
ncbi:MAG: hypothetical protein B6I36_09655 [Desulfobacteraceae bacterium 4572_35.1]|nr:MAG: hypothetical protein B6I36_09655 [Desulfobacteraceae bacterium 4572_35.1]